MSTDQDIPIQSGVLPYRRTDAGPEVLLVTSTTRKRWIIPKGNIEPHLGELESARLEAFEEAGVAGSIRPHPLGSYVHDGGGGPTRVRVYLMEVENVLDSWPEQERRRREWMSSQAAGDRILEIGLKDLLRDFAAESN